MGLEVSLQLVWGQHGEKVSISNSLGGFHHLEVPLAGMGAAGESQGQSSAWGLHCLNPESYGTSSVTHTGSVLQGGDMNSDLLRKSQQLKLQLLYLCLQKYNPASWNQNN